MSFAIRLLINLCGSKDDSYALKDENFITKYSKGSENQLRDTVSRCRVPSKRRIRQLSMEYPEMFIDIAYLIDQGILFDEFVAKRNERVQKIVRYYLNFRDISNPKTHALNRKELKEVCRNFPWPKNDIIESCNLLREMLPKQYNITSAQQRFELTKSLSAKQVTCKTSDTISSISQKSSYESRMNYLKEMVLALNSLRKRDKAFDQGSNTTGFKLYKPTIEQMRL